MTTAIIFIALALVFSMGRILLEKWWANLDASGEERHLGDLAFARGCSVFALFEEAGALWNFSRSKIEADFKN